MLKIYTLNVRGNVLFLDHPNESGDDSVRSSWGKLFETSSWTIASIDMENNSNSSERGAGDFSLNPARRLLNESSVTGPRDL